ncbi:MAG: nitronate monooxygenase family protein [Actinomycetia bacterium]|nr:nitronate monooxygenase family protein [Actinomycetes bacterium]
MELLPLKIGDLQARWPIIQGGMGVGVSLSGLAGAVAAAGGVGVISTAQIGYRDPGFDADPIATNLKAIAREIARARELAGGGVLGVNIMVATRRYADYVRAAVAAGIDLIISGAGLPNKLPELVAGSKTKIAPIVSTIKSAGVILKLWDRRYGRSADLVVIEGPRAGGHLGFSPEQLDTFTQESYEAEIRGIIEVVRGYAGKYATHIPVVVAGGIYDRADIDRALTLGADGVQMATRFVTTYECDVSDAFKQAYLDCDEDDIRIVKSPVGMPGRALATPFLEHAGARRVTGRCHQCLERCDRANIPYCITDALVNAATGDTDNALVFCGDNAWRATRLEQVADIFAELTA